MIEYFWFGLAVIFGLLSIHYFKQFLLPTKPECIACGSKVIENYALYGRFFKPIWFCKEHNWSKDI